MKYQIKGDKQKNLEKKKESVREHRLLFLEREKSVESKKPTLLTWAFCNPGTGLFFQAVSRQVLSLLTVFTFVFGMGTGVFRSHQHQETSRIWFSPVPWKLHTEND